ncbi:anaerobic C4-dicarboxylate transporter family protein [Anaerosinus massiliensis]|uniref:anaerobic C4-dicarboxylate transporter family protein n=1 Tax=Massilibacillus massiliensis TaxID=1806837 RepID=UPI000B335F3C|nr:anaerobic C4-dicarboxylate transporter family protein [Massilibacillus massiliensis]
MFWVQLAIIIICIAIGGRFSGIGLGAAGGFGLAVLTIGFGMALGEPPISVIFIIMAVITCVSILQGAGGLNFLVAIAEKILRKNPSLITFLGPLVCYFFTVICGTSYIAFSVYPIIAEIAIEARIRPERAMSMSVIASNMAIPASPTSAMTAAMIAITAAIGIAPFHIFAVTIPACFIGVLSGCFFVYKRGAELENDPEFKRRLASGEFQEQPSPTKHFIQNSTKQAKISVALFIASIIIIIIISSFPSLLPRLGPENKPMSISALLQVVMLATGALIMVICKVPRDQLDSGSVFKAGLVGSVGIFGISWMTDTFFASYIGVIKEVSSGILLHYPVLFGLALFIVSVVLYSPAATTVMLMPIAVSLGLPPAILIGLIPAACAVFIIPGGAQIGCVAFDRTGTTKIGRFGFNHSYLLPGLVSMVISIICSLAIAQIIF